MAPIPRCLNHAKCYSATLALRQSTSLFDHHEATVPVSSLLYFMHIEKTGGTTVRHNLSGNYPAETFLSAMPLSRLGVDGKPKTLRGHDVDVYELIAEIQDRQRVIRCVAAGLPFGIDAFLEKPVTYFTFLREPVNRCVSCWYFAFKNRMTCPLWSVLESYDFDLRTIALECAIPQFSNDQVRMICGSSSAAIGQADFDMACDAIERRFLLAGALEQFGFCLQVLASRLGWQHVSFSGLNAGVKTDPSILPPLAEQYFRESNEWNVRLYEWLVTKYLPSRLT